MANKPKPKPAPKSNFDPPSGELPKKGTIIFRYTKKKK
jgi:hypothetical protein